MDKNSTKQNTTLLLFKIFNGNFILFLRKINNNKKEKEKFSYKEIEILFQFVIFPVAFAGL